MVLSSEIVLSVIKRRIYSADEVCLPIGATSTLGANKTLRRSTASRSAFCRRNSHRRGITLVEMMIAIAITLVMMAAVVTIFANVSSSISNRRATVEMSTQLRQVRTVLQRDLAHATCPAQPWQRPESNIGYIEINEGAQSDSDPSIWLRDSDSDGEPDQVQGLQIDLTTATIPGSTANRLTLSTSDISTTNVTDGQALGDHDDILMLTVRNETAPFNGRVPSVRDNSGNLRSFANWGSEALQSQLAEVAWFAVENPVEPEDAQTNAFGEPGYRSIYRRVLLIAPNLNYGFPITGGGNSRITGPGVVRVLRRAVQQDDVAEAIASLIAFQDRYDLSVRLEWDQTLGNDGRWTIVANTLADLTKRENRFEHHGYSSVSQERAFPFALASSGIGVDRVNVRFFRDAELLPPNNAENAVANGVSDIEDPVTGVTTYRVSSFGQGYTSRPFVASASATAGGPTPRAIMADDGEDNNLDTQRVVGITNGLVPLSGSRRGEDLMISDVLAFDLRVYDPGAPVYEYDNDFGDANRPLAVVSPGSPGWEIAYRRDVTNNSGAEPSIGDEIANGWRLNSAGAYVDLGYGFVPFGSLPIPFPGYAPGLELPEPQFYSANALSSLSGRLAIEAGFYTVPNGYLLSNGYATYDTWSFHYENNGIDEDGDGLFDEGTNGFDDPGIYLDERNLPNNPIVIPNIRLSGPDDQGEYETTPPYPVPLRGMQVTLRVYERDSRQIREVKVKQAFVPR